MVVAPDAQTRHRTGDPVHSRRRICPGHGRSISRVRQSDRQPDNVPALAIDYPLAPETTLPAAPNAALAAYDYLIEQGFSRLAIVGDSAGGGLSLVTLIQLSRQSEVAKPIAGVAFSPWTDLAFTGASMKDPEQVDPLIGYDYLQAAQTNISAAMPQQTRLRHRYTATSPACRPC